MRREIKPLIRQFIVENFLFGDTSVEFSDEDSLMEAGILDSTGVLELVAFLEREFGIRIPNEDILPAHMDSLNNLEQYLKKKLAMKKAS